MTKQVGDGRQHEETYDEEERYGETGYHIELSIES
jgi:hypothetical protein